MRSNQHNGLGACCGMPLWAWGLLLPVLGAGCGQAARVPVGEKAAGRYALVSVDGKPLPCELKHGNHAMTIRSGAFFIRPDCTCTSQITSGPPASETLHETSATYTCQGSKLTMRWRSGGTTVGFIEGDRFTMGNEGNVFVYRK